jgi:uncharacterized membrane protein
MQEKTKLHYQFLKTKIQQDINYSLNSIINLGLGMIVKMVNIEVLFYILVKIWTKSYHEIDTNNFSQSYLFRLKFKTSIQSCKIWKKHQNNKTNYGVEAFPKKITCSFSILSKNQCSIMIPMSCHK